MNFEAPITDIIALRTSIRSFKREPIPETLYQALSNCCSSLHKGPLGTECRFRLLNAGHPDKQEPLKVGTYGIIRGASTYIAGAVKQGEKNMEDFGYLFEKILLYAADMGLGTCWLGGIFKRSGIAKQMEIEKDEIIPAVSPVGYSTEKRNATDRFIRLFARAKRRKPWQELFFDNDFSHPLQTRDSASPLEMVRLAPSSSNLQPWRILKKESGNYHFYLQRTPGYRRLTRVDLQRLDMGIAMCHFELTAEAINIRGRWTINDPVLEHHPKKLEYIVSWVTF